MAQLKIFVKLFVLCLLEIAVEGEDEKTGSKGQPKNIIVLLGGDMSSDVVTKAWEDLAKKESSDPPNSFMLPFEQMPIHGAILPEEPKSNASGVDLSSLRIMFNGLDSEDRSGNHTTVRASSNLMYLAQQAGKATGLVTTLDVTSEIPATIYGAHFETSGPVTSNCSDHQLSNMDVMMGQDPFSSKKSLIPEVKELKKCIFNYTYLSNPDPLIFRSLEELKTASKTEGKKVIGLFQTMDFVDLKKMTFSALQMLKENENGFFLVVTIEHRNPMRTVKMVSKLLKDLLPPDIMLETLVIVTSVKGTVTCCTPSLPNSVKNSHGGAQPSSVLTSKQGNYASDPSTIASVLPNGNTREKSKDATELPLPKTTDMAMENSESDKLATVPSETASKMESNGEENALLATMESITHKDELLPVSPMTTEKIPPEGISTLHPGNSIKAEENSTPRNNLPAGSTLDSTELNSETYPGSSIKAEANSTPRYNVAVGSTLGSTELNTEIYSGSSIKAEANSTPRNNLPAGSTLDSTELNSETYPGSSIKAEENSTPINNLAVGSTLGSTELNTETYPGSSIKAEANSTPRYNVAVGSTLGSTELNTEIYSGSSIKAEANSTPRNNVAVGSTLGSTELNTEIYSGSSIKAEENSTPINNLAVGSTLGSTELNTEIYSGSSIKAEENSTPRNNLPAGSTLGSTELNTETYPGSSIKAEENSTPRNNVAVGSTLDSTELYTETYPGSSIKAEENSIPRNNLAVGSTLGSTELNSETYSDATDSVSSSSAATSLFTTETSIVDDQVNTLSTDAGSSAIEEHTTESVHTNGDKFHPNGTKYALVSSADRNKRESELLQGIPLYASGPGSSSLRGNIKPLLFWNILEKSIYSASKSPAKFSGIKEDSRKINETGELDLSAVGPQSSSSLIWDKANFLGLGIAVTSILVILN